MHHGRFHAEGVKISHQANEKEKDENGTHAAKGMETSHQVNEKQKEDDDIIAWEDSEYYRRILKHTSSLSFSGSASKTSRKSKKSKTSRKSSSEDGSPTSKSGKGSTKSSKVSTSCESDKTLANADGCSRVRDLVSVQVADEAQQRGGNKNGEEQDHDQGTKPKPKFWFRIQNFISATRFKIGAKSKKVLRARQSRVRVMGEGDQ